MAEAGVELPVPAAAHHVRTRRWTASARDRPDTPLRHGARRPVRASSPARGFKVFAGALASGGVVKGLRVEGGGSFPRSRIDALNQSALDAGAKGLAWFAVSAEGEVRSSRSPSSSPTTRSPRMREALGLADGDLALLVADSRDTANEVLGVLRVELGRGARARRRTASRRCGSSTSRC